jgi:CheY-like chemotaxis protein
MVGDGSRRNGEYSRFMAGSRHILLVEDDPSIQGAISLLLEREGFRVSCAGNGAEALALLGAGDDPALILLDMMMPVMNGLEFRIEQHRDPRLATIPVVVLSATPGSEAWPDLPPPSAVMPKPFDIDQLLEVVEKHSRR